MDQSFYVPFGVVGALVAVAYIHYLNIVALARGYAEAEKDKNALIRDLVKAAIAPLELPDGHGQPPPATAMEKG